MAPDDSYRVSNNADWRRSYGVNRRAAVSPPWAGTPAWASATHYAPGDARTFGADLFIVRPGIDAGGFTSTAAFADDVNDAGASLWVLVGLAASYAVVPFDLTGASLVMAVKAIDASGTIIDPRPKLQCGTLDGCLTITSPSQGGITETIPRSRVRTIPGGLYAFDVVATFPDGRVERVKFGPLVVNDGIATS